MIEKFVEKNLLNVKNSAAAIRLLWMFYQFSFSV